MTKRNMIMALLLGLCMAFAIAWFIESAEAAPPKGGPLAYCSLKLTVPQYRPIQNRIHATLTMECTQPVRIIRIFAALLRRIGQDYRAEPSPPPNGFKSWSGQWATSTKLFLWHDCLHTVTGAEYDWELSVYAQWWDGRRTQHRQKRSPYITRRCF